MNAVEDGVDFGKIEIIQREMAGRAESGRGTMIAYWREAAMRVGTWARKWAMLVAAVCAGGRASGQAGAVAVPATNVHHEANFDQERAKANDLYLVHKELEALPLYTDLCRQDATVAVFAERHGGGLFAKAATETDDAAAKRDRDEGMAELKRAQSLGDHSDYVENLLSAFGTADTAGGTAGTSGANAATPAGAAPAMTMSAGYRDTDNAQAKAWMKQAEAAFAKSDTKTALEDYTQAAEADPGYYGAKLYAGDACFKAGDYVCAGKWFERAIAVDPNRETAYRYWGDALYKGGHAAAAKTMYEQAVVAEPYTRFSWSGLTQWGTVTHTAMGSPPVQRPGIDDKGPAAKITMPQGPVGDIAVWTAYAGCRVDADKGRAAGIRRTAAEEIHCLEVALDFGDAQVAAGKADANAFGPGVKALRSLRNDGMLECWLLLNGADQEVLRDYPAYREAHRELLRAYVDKYVVHEGQPGAAKLEVQR